MDAVRIFRTRVRAGRKTERHAGAPPQGHRGPAKLRVDENVIFGVL